MEFKDLFKYTDNELKLLLGTSTQLGKGRYVLLTHNTPSLITKIYKITERTKDYVILNESLMKYIWDYKVLNYNDFIQLKKELLTSHYKKKKVIFFKKTFKEVFSRLYPKYRYDIQYDKEYNMVRGIVYYPEKKITNSVGLEHTMKDIYLTIDILYSQPDEVFYLNSLGMFRATYTLPEIFNRYTFSHTTGNPGELITSFCFGSTSLSNFTSRLRREITNPVDDIEALLIALEEYLTWESIEGVPYRHIQEIRDFKTIHKSPYIDEETVKFAYNKVISKLENIEYDYNVNLSNRELKLTPQYKSKLSEILVKEFKNVGRSSVVGKMHNGVFGDITPYSKEDYQNYLTRILNKEGLKYKGFYIKPTIEEYNGESAIADIPDVIAPNLLDRVSTIISEELDDYIYKIKNNVL